MKYTRTNLTNGGRHSKYILAREQGFQEGKNFAIKNYSAVLLLCLKDKFDFTTEQLQEIAVHVNNTFDSVCEGYLSLEDIAKTLKEENDINLQINGLDEVRPFVDPSRKLEEINELNQGTPSTGFEDYQTKYLSFPSISSQKGTSDVIRCPSDPRGELERQLRKAGYL